MKFILSFILSSILERTCRVRVRVRVLYLLRSRSRRLCRTPCVWSRRRGHGQGSRSKYRYWGGLRRNRSHSRCQCWDGSTSRGATAPSSSSLFLVVQHGEVGDVIASEFHEWNDGVGSGHGVTNVAILGKKTKRKKDICVPVRKEKESYTGKKESKKDIYLPYRMTARSSGSRWSLRR